MTVPYKFKPEEFENVIFLKEELAKFYELLEIYKAEKTQNAEFALANHSEMLFFTIKHRELEGAITHRKAEDLREYLGELRYG